MVAGGSWHGVKHRLPTMLTAEMLGKGPNYGTQWHPKIYQEWVFVL
jgi:hypothetical protein